MAKLLHVRPTQHRLSLQRERGDRIGDRIDQELAPDQCREIVAAQDPKRRALKKRGEAAAGFVVRNRQILIGALPQPHPIGRQPFPVVVDDHRQHRRALGQRRDARDMADAVLQNRDAGGRRTQLSQPRRRGFGLMRLGAKQHPVDRLGVCRLGERIEPDLNGAARLVERK